MHQVHTVHNACPSLCLKCDRIYFGESRTLLVFLLRGAGAGAGVGEGGRIIIMASFRDQQQPAPSTPHTFPPNRLLLPFSRRPLYGLGDPTKQAFRIEFDVENNLGNSETTATQRAWKPCRSNNNYAMPFFQTPFLTEICWWGPFRFRPLQPHFFLDMSGDRCV